MRKFTSVVALFVTVSVVHADEWRTYRHDTRRSGASSGAVPIDEPTVAFRTYLGGTLRSDAFVDVDVDGDGRVELLYVSGGRVAAKRGDNVALWESPIVPVDKILGFADFDEDGREDLILMRRYQLPSRLLVMSTLDGSILWELPAEASDRFGGVRVHDFDGDGHLDIYFGTGQCGTGQTAPPGVVYTFCDASGCGYDRAAPLWTLTPGTPSGDPGGNCGAGGDVADIDGDGVAELILPWEYSELPIYRASTGTRVDALPRFAAGNYNRGATGVVPFQLDADPELEIIAHIDSFTANQGARRLAVFDHNGSSMQLLWEVVGPDRANDRVIFDRGTAVADLNGDGSVEVVVSTRIGGTPWTTTIRDALTGTVRATLDNEILSGVVDVDADGSPEIITRSGDGTRAWSYDGTASELWRVADRTPMTWVDARLGASTTHQTRLVTLQLDDDPALEIVLGESGIDGFIAIEAYDADSGDSIGSFRAVDGTTVVRVAPVGPMTRDYPQLVAVQSDGYALILDRDLNVTNRVEDGEFVEPGMRIGGFFTGVQTHFPAPLIGRCADGLSILVPTSRGSLERYDASSANALSAPVRLDSIARTRWSTFMEIDGSDPLELVTYEGSDVVIRSCRSGVRELRRITGLAPTSFIDGPLPAVGPSSAAEIVVTRQHAGGLLSYARVDVTTSITRWSTTPLLASWGPGNHISSASADLDGDGVDDLVTVQNGARVYDGAAGTQRWASPSFMAGGVPLVTNMDADPQLEVFAHGAWQAAHALDTDGSTIWTRDGEIENRTFAAEVRCGGTPTFVHGELGRADIYATRGSDGSELAHRVLIAGESYAPSLAPIDAPPAIVGHVTAVASLGSSGAPAVLVGNVDGWLYALDPCTLEKRWTLDLRYPVGAPVVGDVDDDGDDDLIVSVADGYLYGITEAAYEEVNVRDVVPGMPAADIDEINTRDTLYAAWDRVPGATSYIVSVFTEFGSEIRFPNAREVGLVTEATLTELPLVLGGRYVVAVQAVGPEGPGIEGRSDGVVVVDTEGPTASISAAPNPAWPMAGIEPTITARCDDSVGLASLVMRLQWPDGRTQVLREILDVASTSASESITWNGVDPSDGAQAPAGIYTALVECTDREGAVGVSNASLELDPDAMPPADGGSSPDAGPGSGGGDPGCACRTTGASSHLSALAFLWLVSRRRRSARL